MIYLLYDCTDQENLSLKTVPDIVLDFVRGRFCMHAGSPFPIRHEC